MKLFILPDYGDGPDQGDGGIRRVVEAQKKHLPSYDIEIVQSLDEADIVACHAGNWVGTDKPTVAHVHGLYWNEYSWPNWCALMNKAVINSMRWANVVTAPSEWVAQILRRGMWLRPVVLYHGIDIEDWLPGQSEGYVLWNKTREDPICDSSYMTKLASMAPNQQFVSTLGGNLSNIKLTGRLPFDKGKELIRNAGVYLCTSRETFGIGTLEAMACGVPVLGFNWGGQREFVQHKVHGYMAAPFNYDDLRAGLDYCLQHRQELSANARQLVVENYSWSKVMKRYAQTYEVAMRLHDRGGPLVSVVVPCYKLEQYLEECVNSVFSQEEAPSFEIIVVDDASPTWNTIENSTWINDSRIRVIHNQENQYLAGALNTGIAAARGKYVYPLDADNKIGERTLKVLSDALNNNRDLDIVYGKVKFITESGEPDASVSYDGISTWPPETFDFGYQMLHRNQIPSSSMYRKEVWERSGGYRSRCKTAEDADFWCRSARLGFRPARVTDAITLIYRNRPDSMSRVEKDWKWEAWYPESREQKLTPFGVLGWHHNVPTYEPILVSVVIPCGPGHDKLVVDAVDSVAAQTFQKWEVIVVNDSNSEISGLPPFVKLIRTSGAEGPSKARNAGIRVAQGHTFVLLDADDYLQPNALELMYETFKKFGGYVYSDWIKQETGTTEYCRDWDCESLLQKMPHAVTALYPKEAWAKVGGFDEALEGWEDWDFIIALNAAGYCGTRVPVPLFHYRLESGFRREQLYARQDDLKENIRAKWREYIDGGKKLMACGGCSGGGGGTYQSGESVLERLQSSDGMVMLEYIGPDNAPRTWVGPSGQSYRFGNAGHKMKYVRPQDVDHLINFGVFRTYEVSKSVPVLEAIG